MDEAARQQCFVALYALIGQDTQYAVLSCQALFYFGWQYPTLTHATADYRSGRLDYTHEYSLSNRLVCRSSSDIAPYQFCVFT